MRRALVLVWAVSIALAPGCGTIFGLAFDRELEVVTNPPGAALRVDAIPISATAPGTVLLDPAAEHRVDAHLGDLHGGTQVTRSTRTGIVVLNIFLTAGLGLWIDYLTGALYHFPDRVVLNLGRPFEHEQPPPSAQYPPAPALMPHTDPLAPPRPAPPAPKGDGVARDLLAPDDAPSAPATARGAETSRTTDLRRADVTACEICGAAVARGQTCPRCGQPSGAEESVETRDVLAPR